MKVRLVLGACVGLVFLSAAASKLHAPLSVLVELREVVANGTAARAWFALLVGWECYLGMTLILHQEERVLILAVGTLAVLSGWILWRATSGSWASDCSCLGGWAPSSYAGALVRNAGLISVCIVALGLSRAARRHAAEVDV